MAVISNNQNGAFKNVVLNNKTSNNYTFFFRLCDGFRLADVRERSGERRHSHLLMFQGNERNIIGQW